MKKGENHNPEDIGAKPQRPKTLRYRTNDSSYEALGELMQDNPRGILFERDGLVSLLVYLDQEEHSTTRGFFLSGASGNQPYSFDRIGRGHIPLEAVCVSLLGSTQPAKICEYIRRANTGDTGGDGLMQRFGLAIWPDTSREWNDVDRYPNSEARDRAYRVFSRAAAVDLGEALKMGAQMGQFDNVPWLRFSEAAHACFVEWRTRLESKLRSDDLSPALTGHFAKYRKLIPALALINAVADNECNEVSLQSLERALTLAEYLESHAHRIYKSATQGDATAARAILKHIRMGELKDGFTAREVHQHRWAHLSDHGGVLAGLAMLCDLDYLSAQVEKLRPEGGRPKTTYLINPKVTGQ
jgi:hypothetical protein